MYINRHYNVNTVQAYNYRQQHVRFYYLHTTTCNICCIRLRSLQLPEDGHILWRKHVRGVNNIVQQVGSDSLCTCNLKTLIAD